jgi:hypothetical protein
MKVAEGLLLRSDLQKRLDSLRERIGRSALVQEGEKPAEDPRALLDQVFAVSDQLTRLVFAINEANFTGATARGRSLTEALAERDSLTRRHAILEAAAAHASKPPDRYGLKEIRWVAVLDVAEVRRSLDDLARQIREINVEIQAANWVVDLKNV